MMRKELNIQIPYRALANTIQDQASELRFRFLNLINSNTILCDDDLGFYYKVVGIDVCDSPIDFCMECRVVIEIVAEKNLSSEYKELTDMISKSIGISLLPTKPAETKSAGEECSLI